jgi:hypothetical protein
MPRESKVTSSVWDPAKPVYRGDLGRFHERPFSPYGYPRAWGRVPLAYGYIPQACLAPPADAPGRPDRGARGGVGVACALWVRLGGLSRRTPPRQALPTCSSCPLVDSPRLWWPRRHTTAQPFPWCPEGRSHPRRHRWCPRSPRRACARARGAHGVWQGLAARGMRHAELVRALAEGQRPVQAGLPWTQGHGAPLPRPLLLSTTAITTLWRMALPPVAFGAFAHACSDSSPERHARMGKSAFGW